MAIANTVAAIKQVTVDADILTENYSVAYKDLPRPIYMLRIVNDSNKGIYISYDGFTDNDFIPADTTMQLPFHTSRGPGSKGVQLAKGTNIYIKKEDGKKGKGIIHISGYYNVIK